jgi:hypothetical protein
MNFLTPELLSNLLKVHFLNAFKGQEVNVLVAPQDTGNGLFFQVNQPSLPAYQSEPKMFGKTIRLLIDLNDKHPFQTQLGTYNINKVIVTHAAHPQLMTKANSVILNSSFLIDIFNHLKTLRSTAPKLAEQAIQSLIAENAHL